MTTADNSLLAPSDSLSPVGWAAIVGGLVVAVWSIPGLIINPDFAIGDDATSKLVLGVDMNGWHAVSGFLVTIPAFLVARRPYLAAVFCAASAGALLTTAAWALVTEHAAGGLFYFPNATGDVVLHVATSLIFVAGAAWYFRRA
jgi:hypothetical protein